MVVTTAYVLGLYIWLCDSWILAGTWDWMGRPRWPQWILWLRDGCVLFFLGNALFLIVRDGRRALFRAGED